MKSFVPSSLWWRAQMFALLACLAFGVACSGALRGGDDPSPDPGGAADQAGGKTDLDSNVRVLPDGGRILLDGATRLDASSGQSLDAQGGEADTGKAADATVNGSADGCPPGAPRALNRVRFYPVGGKAAALVGGTFQGSNTSQTNDFVELAKIEQTPADDAYTELKFANDKVYRYIKYYSPANSYGSVAELEFYHDDTRLQGDGFGTASTVAGVSYALALDGETATAYQGSLADGNYIGLDIGKNAVVATPTFSPAAGALASATQIAISSSTAGASIRYTLDGTNPSATVGSSYSAPVPVSDGRVTVSAVASADCQFDSATATATYTVGATTPPVTKGLKSYHIGNSLTDTINPWLKPIADSTGVTHTFARWTIPGAPIGYIWENKGDGIGTPEEAVNFDSFVKSYAPIDHLTVQPFADPNIMQQGGAAVGMVEGVRAYSPDVQAWIYAQWASPRDWQRDPFANGEPSATPPWNVATKPADWTSATNNQVLYYEAFRNWVDDNAGGKRVLVIPAGLALVELQRQVNAGLVPGISDFFGFSFQDDLHLNPPTQYLVALVFYSCFYKQTPEGRVVVPPELGLTDAQAKLFQRIAWSVASAYPLSGISAP